MWEQLEVGVWGMLLLAVLIVEVMGFLVSSTSVSAAVGGGKVVVDTRCVAALVPFTRWIQPRVDSLNHPPSHQTMYHS